MTLRRFLVLYCSEVVTIHFNILASHVLLFITVCIPIIGCYCYYYYYYHHRHYYSKRKVKYTVVQALKLCTGHMVHRGVEV